MSDKWKLKGFTILELLVVVAIIAILAVIAIPNFIGRIDEAKDSQELAEINAVGKAIATYYADTGVYPTLQGKDGTLLQAQPIEGAPHNIDFSSLVPDYLASLPHFSYWWVDYDGKVYHTQKAIGTVSSSVFTPTTGYTYTLHKTNGTTQVLSAPYTLQAGEYIVGKDDSGVDLPKISSVFKNAKVHPESGYVVVTGVSLNKVTDTLLIGGTSTLVATVTPSDAPNKSVTWSTSNASVATVSSSGVVTAVSTGTATITVTTIDGSKTATCIVTVTTPPTVQAYNYTGGSQTYTVPVSGTYKLEAWGAEGGTSYNSTDGGEGAYATGTLALTAGQTIHVYVGQQGQMIAGGWNGGGSGSINRADNGGGGGGTDFRLTSGSWNNATSLNSRVLVAAGGAGGNHGDSANPNGGAASSFGNFPASASSGGQGAGFGYGTNVNANAGYPTGGGGGGWYGGGGVLGGTSIYLTSSGGSSYAYTSTSHKPSGYAPSTAFYMSNVSLIQGGATMPNPAGGTMVGNNGHGSAKITYVGP